MDTVEKLHQEGCLQNCELFLFNDNIVTDYAYHKSISSSKTLFILVLRLRKLQMEGEFIVHLINISVDRMIDCGIDALLRGSSTERVMREGPILTFLT